MPFQKKKNPVAVRKGSVVGNLLSVDQVAREAANMFLSDSVESGEMLMQVLERKEPALVPMDNGFGVELAFFRWVVSAEGRARWQQQLTSLLPTSTRHQSLQGLSWGGLACHYSSVCD